MDPETLERLLLDRALGALPPDTAALLDAYLTDHPDAAAAASEWSATTHLAGQALADPSPIRLPAFPMQRIASAAMRQRRLNLVWQAAGLAACLLLGMGIGRAMVGTPQPAGPSPGQSTAVVLNEPRQTSETSHDGFWSTRRLYERATGAPQPRVSSPRVIWDSPLSIPRVGDAT